MAKKSAGLLAYRIAGAEVELFLVHPGGPFWKAKDEGSWTIPKGEFEPDEDPEAAARREFQEETGFAVSAGELLRLDPVKQPSGKIIHAWAVCQDMDPAELRSNTFPLEWPPRSGRMQDFPEIDAGAWFGAEAAFTKLQKGQIPLVRQLLSLLQQRGG